jgi:putative redox protein
MRHGIRAPRHHVEDEEEKAHTRDGGLPMSEKIQESSGEALGGGEPREVIVHGNASGFAQEIRVGRHTLSADEPTDAGGTDSGPTPYDFLISALGACTSMTVSLYARRKQWPLEGVTVKLRHSRVHATDCADCEPKGRMLDRIERDVHLEGNLDEEQRARLLEIASKCPVHKTIVSKIDIQTRLVCKEDTG